MKLVRVGPIAAAILAVAPVAWAQKPDCSGTWTLDPASAPATGGGGGASTQVWTVEGSTLTVETADARGLQKRVYKKSL
jgi:hypothetical protein